MRRLEVEARRAAAAAGAPRPGRPATWLWLALLAGAALRLYFVFFTQGTSDVAIWLRHARGVHELGLAEYYHRGYRFNHPPSVGLFMAGLYDLSHALGVPFRILLRAPFAVLDLGTTLLLRRLLRDSPRRDAIAALYWLCPLSILYSAYHGNTDGAVAFFSLLAVLLVSEGRPAGAGAAVGAGLAVKLPGILAAPVLVFALPDARSRLRFALATAGLAAVGYAPGLLRDPPIVVQDVFLYAGQNIQSTAGIRVWGIQNFYPLLLSLPDAWHRGILAATGAYYALNTPVCLALITLLAFARRREREPRALAASVGMAFSIFYGFTNYWSFQYFAWSIPFLLCLDLRLALPMLGLMSAYVYGLYAFVCDDLALRGTWDFVGHPLWPSWLLGLRDASVALFFVAGCAFLARALGPARRGAEAAGARRDAA